MRVERGRMRGAAGWSLAVLVVAATVVPPAAGDAHGVEGAAVPGGRPGPATGLATDDQRPAQRPAASNNGAVTAGDGDTHAVVAAAVPGGRPGPAASTGGAADPFYMNLLRDGTFAYERGDHARAARDLRIAVFGLLDDPPLLAEGLVRLALAQGALDDTEAVRETFSRLLDVEERVGGYREADLPSETRRAFEELAAARVPAETLLASETFRPLGRERLARQLEGLAPETRRQRLARLVERDPDHAPWRLALAELELAAGEPRRADQLLAGLDQSGRDGRLHCLRGRALAALDDCAAAAPELARCPASLEEEELALARLGCLVGLGAWGEAREHLAKLAPEVARSRGVRRLERRIERAPEPAAEPLPTIGPIEGVGEEAAAELSAEELALLEEGRRTLDGATTTAEIYAALDRLRPIADAHPDNAAAQHLLGELAYRAGRWQDAVRYFRRGGDPGDDQPALLFYIAVSHYEGGDAETGVPYLRRALPHLHRTDYVDAYVERILGPDTDR